MTSAAEVLLVDDNPADSDLTCEVLTGGREQLQVRMVSDGVEAFAYLHHLGKYSGAALPDLILLDLNLPRRDGRAVLADIKQDASLRKIPVVVFTTSQAAQDIARSYELGANSYVTKPGNLRDFVSAVKSLEEFWLRFATLPVEENHD
jgi:CheY-like chemotaxis protein